jgi:short-subunit dehydrogenase
MGMGLAVSRGIIDAHGGRLALDVTKSESIAAAIKTAGPIDVLVNNAGIGVVGAFEATPMATAREVFETNTFAGPDAVALAQAR